MRLSVYLRHQKSLQMLMGNPMGTDTDAVKENLLALFVESGEMLQELNWKPWRVQTKKIDRSKVVDELVDIMQFYVNILNELEVSESEFDDAWCAAQAKVKQRVNDDY